jgi:hypothetical protein
MKYNLHHCKVHLVVFVKKYELQSIFYLFARRNVMKRNVVLDLQVENVCEVPIFSSDQPVKTCYFHTATSDANLVPNKLDLVKV